MGVDVEIVIPGKKSAFEAALHKHHEGEMSDNEYWAIHNEQAQIGARWRLGSYGYAEGFLNYIKAVVKREKNQYIKYVIRVLNNMNDFTLHYDEVLVFKQGLSMIEKLLPADMDPEYRETFSNIQKTVALYLKRRNTNAVIHFG